MGTMVGYTVCPVKIKVTIQPPMLFFWGHMSSCLPFPVIHYEVIQKVIA